MVNVNDLYPGVQVEMDDHWTSGTQNISGRMDCYLGQILTVSRIRDDGFFHVEEDHEDWMWHPKDVLRIVGQEDNLVPVSDLSGMDFASLLF
jgi:hypothetical protein